MTEKSEDKMCHFCSNSPEDVSDVLFDAWCNESVDPTTMGLPAGRKALRKTHLKHKFETDSEAIREKIEEAKKAKEDAAVVFEEMEKNINDSSWKFVKKDDPLFGVNVSAVPALKYFTDEDITKFGKWTVETYKDVLDSGIVPENIDKIMKIMEKLGYNNNLKSFWQDLVYTRDRVKLFKSIKVPEEIKFEDYIKEAYWSADPYPFSKVKVFGETFYVCPICKEIAKSLKE